MTPRIKAVLAVNRGLITRREALHGGLTDRQIDHLVRDGAWLSVRRGVYAEREFWDGLDEHREQPMYQGRAARMTISLPHVMSHDSSALELNMPILLPRPFVPHVTRAHVHGSRNRFGVKHHGAVFHPDQVVDVEGVPVLNAARTAVDIAREHGLTHGVAACDSAMRMGVSRRELERAYEPMWSWPYVTRVRESVALADPGAESVGESLARKLVLELGIGRPETQFGLRDGGREVWCDLRVGRHVFEFDGRIKYQREQDGGVAVTTADQVVWHEKQRQDWVCGFKLGMSRIVWDDFWGAARARALRRLDREYADTTQRFGPSIADLAPYIISRRRR